MTGSVRSVLAEELEIGMIVRDDDLGGVFGKIRFIERYHLCTSIEIIGCKLDILPNNEGYVYDYVSYDIGTYVKIYYNV